MDNTYSISEVAEKLGLSDKTLRRWEEAGKFSSPRTLGNQRRYTIEDLQILDAIKHGTIPDQKDLLTREQAALLLNVNPVTVDRYVAEGKIHPFITVGTTYFPRHILEAKMQELKSYSSNSQTPEKEKLSPNSFETPLSPIEPTPKISSLPIAPPSLVPTSKSFDYRSSLFSLLSTLLILTLYHFTFNHTPTPASPQPSGSVQGVSTISPQILNLLEDVLDPSGNVAGNNIIAKLGLSTPNLTLLPTTPPTSPVPGTLYYDGSSQLLKIYINNTWVSLATAENLKNTSLDLTSKIASLSAELELITPLAASSTPQIR